MPNSYGSNYGRPVGRAVTTQLGGKWTPAKARFFEAWAQAEGTKAAYNPFATTRRGFAGESQFNSVGVKNYPDLKTGIDATVSTLQLSYYTGLVDLLRRDDVTAEQLAAAVAKSPWGTGTGVLRVLGATQIDGYERAQSIAQYGARKGQLEQQYQTRTLDRFRPSEAYMNALSKMGAGGQAALRVARGFQPYTITEAVDVSGDQGPSGAPAYGPSNGFLQLPMTWKGTHITDNLDLNRGVKSAADIMGDPGTAVGAPEAGTIIRWGSAQGGEALYFRGRSGTMYWIGHIDDRLPVGAKVKSGQVIARISADHPSPHVHIDRTIRRKRRGK
jgi:hypothetical protein